MERGKLYQIEALFWHLHRRLNKTMKTIRLLLVPRNSSRGRGVIPSLAGLGEQSCRRGYYQFGM
jgi:hypothetical protein